MTLITNCILVVSDNGVTFGLISLWIYFSN